MRIYHKIYFSLKISEIYKKYFGTPLGERQGEPVKTPPATEIAESNVVVNSLSRPPQWRAIHAKTI